MVYKPVGADENGKFPPRVQAGIESTVAGAVTPLVADAISNDPTVAAEAAALAQSDAGLLRATDAQVPQLVETDEHLFLGVDSLRRFTDLAYRKSDGALDQAVIARWAPRLAPLLAPLLETSFAPKVYADGARYSRTSDVQPANANTAKIAGWGSSSMDGLVSRLTTTAAGFGATYYNGGRSGQRMQVILARLGSRPAHVTGTIAADTAEAVVTVAEFPPLSFVSFKGWLVLPDGSELYGTLRGPDASTVVFARAVAGPAVTVSGATFIPEDGHANRDAVTILNIGKNNFSGGDVTLDDQVIAATDEAFDWLAPLNKKTVVLGHFANGSFNTGTPTESWNQVKNTNAAHRKRYGSLFIDLDAYVTGSQIWADTGITPTADDLAMQARGVKPTSLSIDDGHLNSAGLDAVNTHLIQPHLAGLGWFN